MSDSLWLFRIPDSFYVVAPSPSPGTPVLGHIPYIWQAEAGEKSGGSNGKCVCVRLEAACIMSVHDFHLIAREADCVV